MAKKKGKSNKSRNLRFAEESTILSTDGELTASAVAMQSQLENKPSPTPPPPKPDVMENILKVLQEPTETMYKGLSQRAQYELSAQEVRELRELFSIFDIGGRGLLSFTVLRRSLRTMGFTADEKELQGALADCNIKAEDGITFSQFVDIVLIEQGDSFDVYEELMSGFTAMDIDRTGKITAQSLRKLANRLEEDLSQAEIDDMISEADKNGNGEITHKEFIAVMLKTNLFRGTSVNTARSDKSDNFP